MSKSFKTFLKHTAKDFHNQSVNPPVVRASTIIFKSMQHLRKTQAKAQKNPVGGHYDCLLYTSPSPRDLMRSRMPSSA